MTVNRPLLGWILLGVFLGLFYDFAAPFIIVTGPLYEGLPSVLTVVAVLGYLLFWVTIFVRTLRRGLRRVEHLWAIAIGIALPIGSHYFIPARPWFGYTGTMEKVLSEGGGVVWRPFAGVRLVWLPGSLWLPQRVELSVIAPGTPPPVPIPDDVHIVRAVRVAQFQILDIDKNNTYWGEALLGVRLKRLIEPVKRNGKYFTDVCYHQPGFDPPHAPLGWRCRPVIFSVTAAQEKKRMNPGDWLNFTIGEHRVRNSAFYVYIVQYPKAVARAGCEAIGGVLQEDSYGFQADSCKIKSVDENGRTTLLWVNRKRWHVAFGRFDRVPTAP